MKRRLLALSILLMLFATPALADATNPAAESDLLEPQSPPNGLWTLPMTSS